MAPESNDVGKQKSIDQEVRDLISTLFNRFHTIQNSEKPGGSTTSVLSQEGDDSQGVRIITLAGTNVGASMRGEMDEKADDDYDMGKPEQEEFATSVNSNFQAINNAIMLGGNYESNDPGVHLDIEDYVNKHGSHDYGKKSKKHRRGRKSGHQSQHSDEGEDEDENEN